MQHKINYQAIWGKTYILLGFLFALLFIIGAIILADWTIFLNIIAAIIVLYIGYSMLKRPYLTYSNNEIVVFNFLGGVRKHYTFKNPKEIIFKQNGYYLNGKKLKLNHWMVDKTQWKRMQLFYNPKQIILDELKDNT